MSVTESYPSSVAVCARCGQESPEGFRFCGACGAELGKESPAGEETRRTVTVLRSDVTGSTALGERLDPESLRRVMSHYFDEMAAVLEHHGGTVEKFIGDAIMAVFGVPTLHEDDALRAVRAAQQMRQRLVPLNDGLERDYGVRIEQRIGVNTGEVVAGDGEAAQRLATGDAVNVAARLEQAAGSGEILVGEATRALVRDAIQVEAVEPIVAKGKSEPVRAWRLVSVAEGAAAFERRFESPLVGRRRELDALRDALARAIEYRSCHLFTVLGPAGIGKSRLVQELTGSGAEGALVLSGRCLPYGDGITFWPLVEIFRVLRAEEELERALAATSSEETFWRLRTALERRADEQPLVVVLDDLHWGELTLLDFVEHVAEWSRDAPILLVCLARPELLDVRPAWGGGKLNATSVLLQPLSRDETDELIAELVEEPLDESERRRIVETSEGNPLFVEEMLAMLDEGTDVDVPPTIHALVAARLDRLGGPERTVLVRAAVEGRVFHRGALAELVPRGLRDDLDAYLRALIRKELIRPDAGDRDLPGETAYRFRHQLISDTAYESLSKEDRAVLHGRYAAWLERTVGTHAPEPEEVAGYHLEQAYRYRTELGPLDDEGVDLGRRAAERLVRGAVRARLRGDDRAAAILIRRAAATVSEGGADWLELAPRLIDFQASVGDVRQARRALDGATEAAAAAGDARTMARLRLERARLASSATAMTLAEALAEVRAVIPLLEEFRDDHSLGLAWLEHGKLTDWLGESERSVAALEQAADYARRAGDRRMESDALFWSGLSALSGPMPASEVERLWRRIGDEMSEVGRVDALHILSLSLAMQGRFHDVHRMREEARLQAEALGVELGDAYYMLGGQALLLEGDDEAAADLLRAGCEHQERRGDPGTMSTTAGYLAEALYRLGQDGDALDAAALSERLASPDDWISQILWRSAAAKPRARSGDVEGAELLAREAVAIAERTDWINEQGGALLALAEVLRTAGEAAEAGDAAKRARALYERKGNVVSAERARRFVEDGD